MTTFYSEYKDTGIIFPALPAVTIIVVIAVIGIIANLLLITITILSKNLRSTANYLLAMECFFDSLHVLAHFHLGYLLYSGKNFEDLFTCYTLMIGPLTGLNFGVVLIFFTAFDRLVAMLLPLKHQQVNKLLYLGGIVAICMTYNLYILYIGYLNARENKDMMVVCLIVEALHGTPSSVWSTTAGALVFGAVSIYVVIGLFIRFRHFANSSTNKLYKSLLILCIVFIFSWIGSLGIFICRVFGLSEEPTFLISLYTGITINIACASNFFVLTRYSTDYRIAAKEFFEKFSIQRIYKSIAKN